MATVYHFPVNEDRNRVHNVINSFAQGKCGRITMMFEIAQVLNKYSVKKMPIYGYSVRILDYLGDLPVISIEGDKITDLCPGCGAGTETARYLRTEKENLFSDFDIIAVTCLECGCVYMTKAPNGRRKKFETGFKRN